MRYRGLALAASVLLTVAACGGDDDDAATSTTTGAEAPAATTEVPATTAGDDDATTTMAGAPPTTVAGGSPTTAAPEPAADGPRIAFAHQLGPDSWDPHLSLGGPTQQLQALVYDRLVHVSPAGEPEPGMAESWEYSDDGLTFTLHLRDGIVFHDGSAFTADSAVRTLERAMALEESDVREELASVAEVAAPDDLTVVITLTAPDSSMPLVLAGRAGLMISPTALDADADLTQEPAGSGPFVLSEYTEGISASFDRNPDYWNPEQILIPGADMTVMNDARARLNALASGEVHLAQLDVSQVSEAEGYGLAIEVSPDIRIYTLQVNPNNYEPLLDPNVRLAISLAIDRQGIVDGVYSGLGGALEQFYQRNLVAHDASIEGAWDRDLDRAKQLLSDAGYPDGLEFEVVTSADPFGNQVLEAIQAQLLEAGIRISISPLEGFGSANAYWNDKTAVSGFFRNTMRLSAVQSALNLVTADAQNNPSGIVNDEVIALLEEARGEPDLDTQIELIKQISGILVETPGNVLPIMEVVSVVGADSSVTGLQDWITGFPNFNGVTITE
jgi:peptide/nickel transport system substrate-binding protein